MCVRPGGQVGSTMLAPSSNRLVRVSVRFFCDDRLDFRARERYGKTHTEFFAVHPHHNGSQGARAELKANARIKLNRRCRVNECTGFGKVQQVRPNLPGRKREHDRSERLQPPGSALLCSVV